MSQLKSRDDVIALKNQNEFLKFLLNLQDCFEAEMIFPDLHFCPCCWAFREVDSAVIHHKDKMIYTN